MKYKRGLALGLVLLTVFSMNGTSLVSAAEQQDSKGTDEKYLLEEKAAYVFGAEPYAPGPYTPEPYAPEPYVPESSAAAVVEDVTVDYDLEKEVLIIEWTGINIGLVDVYQDDVLIAAKVTGERLTLGTKLAPLSKHTYRVVSYGSKGVIGTEKSCSLEVGDYVPKLENVDINYDEKLNQIQMKWDSVYTDYVSIYINYEPIVEKYKQNSYVLNYALQPGASYTVSVEPYNNQDEAGEGATEVLEKGSFEVPDAPDITIGSVGVKDTEGNYTGFSKPAVNLEWEAEKGAVYEIYRAETNKMSAYTWMGRVKAVEDGIYTYTDEKVGIGAYYYKIQRKIVEDDYVQQDVLTAFSDEGTANVTVPKPKLEAQLNENGQILVSMESNREYISGYDIYRKAGKGKFKKIATIAEDEYVDDDIEFGVRYQYKAKAYYYDAGTGKKITGKSSKTAKVKNTIGNIQAEVKAISADTVQISWTAAANAAEYEVYYKSGTQGDSYVLWTTTRKLSIKRKLHKSGDYSFMIKANPAKGKGKAYFSSAEVSCKMGYSAPQGFTVKKTTYAQNPETNQIIQNDTLAWNRVYGAKGYYIELYDKATQKYNRVAEVASGKKTSYTISNPVVAEAKELKYRISAFGSGAAKKGGTVDITVQLGGASDVKAQKSGSGVKISWKAVTGAESYRVYRSNGRNRLLIGETADLTIADKGMSVGVVYQYYVQAVNKTQNIVGAESLPASYGITPAKLSKVTAVNTASGNVQLSWNAVKNASSYILYYRAARDEEFQKIAEVSGKKISYVHEKQAMGSTCQYKVTAVQINGGGIPVESEGAVAKVKIAK